MDTVGNFLTALNNAARVRQPRVVLPASRFTSELARFLEQKGYVAAVKAETEGTRPKVTVTLAYRDAKTPKLHGARRISTPGRRRYAGAGNIPYSFDGVGVVVVSTSQGLKGDRDARKAGLGGELICEVW